MAETRFLDGSIPFLDTWWLKKSNWSTPTSHLAELMFNPYSSSRLKRSWRCFSCSSGPRLATKRSSMYAKTKSSPEHTWLTKRWKVCAAFRKPNGILTNSNNPNGVMMAVFGMSSSATGIWLKARTRSTFEKIVHSLSWSEKFWMWGIGYLSGVVIAFNRR